MDIKKVNSDNLDFIKLTNQLDVDLHAMGSEEADEERFNYDSFNELTDLLWAVIIYDDEKAIGCAAIKKYKEKTAEVKRVFVSNNYRGKGIARKLIDELEKAARLEGYRQLLLETGKSNNVAIKMYQNFHYKIIDNYAPYDKMSDSVCMKKDLSVRP
jgi:putative acetyltransferase